MYESLAIDIVSLWKDYYKCKIRYLLTLLRYLSIDRLIYLFCHKNG